MARLEITTHIGCPINCLDCPQKLLLSKYNGKRMMDFEDYKKVIDKIPSDVRIDFSGMCEPFVNPNCANMILYAYEHGNPLALYTTLQGATIKDYEKLKGVRYEVVTIHLPDCEGRSIFKITKEYLDVLSRWQCNNYSYHGQLEQSVVPYIHKGKNHITFMHDRAGNVESRQHITINAETPVFCCNCGTELNHNVLLPDGTVLMCCMDYGMTSVFGNLFEQSYEDVLNSEEANKAREKMKNQECICKHCTNARRG